MMMIFATYAKDGRTKATLFAALPTGGVITINKSVSSLVALWPKSRIANDMQIKNGR